MKGLALLLAARPKGKGAPSDEDDAPESAEGEDDDSMDAYAREAFSALRDDDEDGFVAAFKGAMGCGKKAATPTEE